MRHRRARVAGIAVCTVMLFAGDGAAETLTYTTPGTTTVTLPVGVARVHVVAVGGRGGGLAGGYGALVTGDVRVDPFPFTSGPTPAPARPVEIQITVAGNGGIGVGGGGGGGAAGFGPPLPTLAGGGGGASSVETCRRLRADGACAFLRQVVAGGGGGAGADGLPGTGGAGGAAGATAAAGTAGSSTAMLTAAGGGSGATTTTGGTGGAGSVSGDPACEGGSSGTAALSRAGGAGGLSADLAGHGDAGGGGGGTYGGGGGGGGGFCADDSGTPGGGGGAGASQAPGGGQFATDTIGQPSVTISYELEHPSVTIRVPAADAEYVHGRRVLASYRCWPTFLRASMTSCAGPVASGQSIDTRTLGDSAFTVNVQDSLGLTFEQTVHYRVVDRTRPRVARLKLRPSTIDLASAEPSARVRYSLSESAQVRIRVHRVRAAREALARVRVVAGSGGRNSFTLRARIGRRTLRPGAYRLVLVATDPSGNRSRPVTRRFRVVDSDS